MLQVLLTGAYDKKDTAVKNVLQGHKKMAEAFMCSSLPGSPNKQVQTTGGG